MMRLLNTRPIRATVGGRVYESIDADALARHVFEQIDAMETELKPVIAKNFVEALFTGSNEEKAALIAAGSQSLASLYEPPRGLPPPPVVIVSAAPAPMPDYRQWVLTWNVQSDDVAGTAFSIEPLPDYTVEATPYERALLALDFAAIAATPVDPQTHPPMEVPNGPKSGEATFDVTESMGIRAVAIRDGATTAYQSEVLAPAIDRIETIALSLETIAALAPSRVEVWYEHELSRLPVLLVIDNFDVPLVEGAIAEWRVQTEAPPDGELIFDVTAARLRLRRVVLR